MSVRNALGALSAMRCQGVLSGHHYPPGAPVSDYPPLPCLIWTFWVQGDGLYQPEVYDLESARLLAGMRLRLLTAGFVDAEASDMPVSDWVDRLMMMLSTDMLLGGALTMPLGGALREVGAVEFRGNRYWGVVMDLVLSVRIEAP